MTTIEALQNTAIEFRDLPSWGPQGGCYRCHVHLIREDDGSFSAIVLNLPGTGSCGDTEEEAMKNVREAILGVIESYSENMEDIPWASQEDYCVPEGTKKWIVVNV